VRVILYVQGLRKVSIFLANCTIVRSEWTCPSEPVRLKKFMLYNEGRKVHKWRPKCESHVGYGKILCSIIRNAIKEKVQSSAYLHPKQIALPSANEKVTEKSTD
jgi:hypothetical protein